MENRTINEVKSDEHLIKDLDSTELVAGYDTLIAVANPRSNPPYGPGQQDYQIIGFVQSETYTNRRTVVQVGELGSNSIFTLLMDGQKGFTFNRILVKGNILRAFYTAMPEPKNDLSNSQIWIDLDNSYFDNPINIMLSYLGNVHDEDTAPREVKATIEMQNALIGAFTQPIRQGDYSIIESISVTWEKTKEL